MYSSHTTTSYVDDVIHIEKDISKGDTLLSFSIKFNCNVNDLKKANNLTTDQDFYTLKKIRIPVKKHGIFAEEESQVVTSRYDDDASEEKVDVSGSSNGEEFLKSMDKNIKDVSSNNQEVLEEVVTTLGSNTYRPLRVTSGNSECSHDNWRWYLATMVLVGVLVVIVITSDLMELSSEKPHDDVIRQHFHHSYDDV